MKRQYDDGILTDAEIADALGRAFLVLLGVVAGAVAVVRRVRRAS